MQRAAPKNDRHHGRSMLRPYSLSLGYTEKHGKRMRFCASEMWTPRMVSASPGVFTGQSIYAVPTVPEVGMFLTVIIESQSF
jgi:hypothetical protein